MPHDDTAWFTYLRELRQLHVAAGAPSSRAIVQRVSRHGDPMSHTTANQILQGQRLASWAVTARVIEALGGDVQRFEGLWQQVRLEAQAKNPLPPPPKIAAQLSPGELALFEELAAIRSALERIADALCDPSDSQAAAGLPRSTVS